MIFYKLADLSEIFSKAFKKDSEYENKEVPGDFCEKSFDPEVQREARLQEMSGHGDNGENQGVGKTL